MSLCLYVCVFVICECAEGEEGQEGQEGREGTAGAGGGQRGRASARVGRQVEWVVSLAGGRAGFRCSGYHVGRFVGKQCAGESVLHWHDGFVGCCAGVPCAVGTPQVRGTARLFPLAAEPSASFPPLSEGALVMEPLLPRRVWAGIGAEGRGARMAWSAGGLPASRRCIFAHLAGAYGVYACAESDCRRTLGGDSSPGCRAIVSVVAHASCGVGCGRTSCVRARRRRPAAHKCSAGGGESTVSARWLHKFGASAPEIRGQTLSKGRLVQQPPPPPQTRPHC